MLKRWALLISVILLMGGVFTGLVQLRERFTQDQGEIRGTVLWLATEVNREYWRFLGALGRYSLGDETINQDEFLLRFDLFWSQFYNYRSGDLGKRLIEASDGEQVVSDIENLLMEIEQDVVNLRKGDFAKGQALRERILQVAQPLHEMTQRIDKAENDYFVGVFDQTEDTLNTLSILVLFLSATGVVLIVLLTRETNRSKHLSDVAQQSELTVRVLNEKLEQRIDERTSQLRETLFRLDEAQSMARIGNFNWDLLTGKVQWSDNMYRLVKYDPDIDVDIDAINAKIHHPDDLPWVSDWLQDGIENCRENLEPKEYRIICKDGEVIWIQCRASIESENGKALRMVGTVQDISKQWETETALRSLSASLEDRVNKRTEELEQQGKELQAANDKLQDIDQLKSMFIASMSHELRTPLNSIIGFTGMLVGDLAGPITPQQRDYLERAHSSGKHLLGLITDIIDISKIEAGKLAVVYEEFDAAGVIREAVDALEKEAQNKGLQLRVEPLEAINLYSDRKRLLQCIFNLLSNGIKYTEAGSVEIKLAQKNKDLEITVTDSGIGISKTDLSKLFQPFERFVWAHREHIPGTGLGLYLTKKLAEEILRGEIKVNSKEGEGSSFVLRIPMRIETINESSDEGRNQ